MSYDIVSAFPQSLEQFWKWSHYSVISSLIIQSPDNFQIQIVLSWGYQEFIVIGPLGSWSSYLRGGKKCTYKTEVIHQSIYLFCFVSYHLLISFGQTATFCNILLSKDKISSFWAPKQSELGKHKFQEIRNIGFLDDVIRWRL